MLAYYCIASLLLMRWDRAYKCKALAEEILNELIPNFFSILLCQLCNVETSLIM